ncbi:MAG: N-acetylmuramoyl-L-alanine amidase [Acidobacteria bacterium]|nr:N-acetylmuramoyl-L-alanine amidase [Acidobacteriota bacterium]
MTPTLAPRVLLAALALVVSAAVSLAAEAQSARQRYETALEHQAVVRTAAEKVSPTAATPALDEVVRPARRVVAEFDVLVRRFPKSGYSDNALLQAATLSQFLYSRFGRAADRIAAEKYYGWLMREYPVSPFRRQARTAVRALAAIVPASQKPAPAVADAAAPPPALPASARTAPPQTAGAAEPAEAGLPSISTLLAIDRAVVESTVRITLSLDRETPFSHELLAGPPRAFVDLFGATVAESLQDATLPVDGDAVRQVRVGQRPGAVRVVLDLAGATPVSVFTLYNPYRVVIDAERVFAPPTGRGAAAVSLPASAPVVPVAIDTAPSVQLVNENEVDVAPHEVVAGAPAADDATSAPAAVTPSVAPEPRVPPPAVTPAPSARVAAATPAAPSAPAPSEPAANADGKFSLSRQLGLGISRIVIDPGHGGHDPGTLTSGSSEARLVLDVALRLEKLLVKNGFDVVLTRRTDVFVPLEQRPAIANREGADLFLSIHANASRNLKARGVEVYYLSFASNSEAEAVAARENSTSAGGMHNLPSIVRAIALNNKLDESRDLAAMVQKSLASHLAGSNPGLPSRGVKKAPFVVLIGTQMPAVLAEIGVITNTREAALIKTPAYRQKVAESLQAAVVQYQRALKRQTAVAAR